MNIHKKTYITPLMQTFALLIETPLLDTSLIHSGGNSSNLQGSGGVIEAQSQKRNPIWDTE